MMRQIKQNLHLIIWFVLAILLSSCHPATPESTTTQTIQPTSPLFPTLPYTLTPSPCLPPTSTPTNIPSMPPPRAMRDDEKLYLDPEGWFSVYVPGEWEEGETPGSFSDENGFIEIGYLPEFGFMERELSVYVWLANIVEQPKNTNIWLTGKLETIIETGETVVQFVFKNPAAGYEHRFVHLKGDQEHIESIENSFAWLRPVTQETELDFHQLGLRPEDATFWDNTAPLPDGLSIKEFKLVGESLMLQRTSFPSEALALEDELREKYYSSRPDRSSDEDILAPFGFELKEYHDPHRNILYRDGKIFIDNVINVGGVYLFPAISGESIAFIVNTFSRDEDSSDFHSYIVIDHTIIEREYRYHDPYHRDPVMKDGELLWVRYSDTHVRVENIREEIVFDFSTVNGTTLPLRFFQGWENHWVLGVGNFIIQDGEILNEKYDYEEAFSWSIVNDKPLYFFRKGNRVGISYNGEILPIYYHNIHHGIWGGQGNEPLTWGNSLRFFGQRDGVWYVVIMEFD